MVIALMAGFRPGTSPPPVRIASVPFVLGIVDCIGTLGTTNLRVNASIRRSFASQDANTSRRDARMNRRLWLMVFVGAAAAVTTNGCQKPEVRPEELFRAQSRGLGFLETGQLPEAEAEFKK